ncbi:MAG: bifunctional (p)ppGpp synthetase/guanosine-3',5'-bis(diphosphate) 3'-pyrophosphohydrolase [Rickettsiales bacterium]
MNCNKLLQKIEKYNNCFNPQQVIKAFKFAKKAHANQIRASGEPYYYHPLEVAIILADMQLDEDSIITALLHDTLEDTIITMEDIQLHFGDSVAKLVDGVTKLTKIKFQPDNIRQGENFRKLLLAMSEDIRVLIVKLADRLHNMRTINYLSEKKAMRIAIETMEIYVPLAERIGMQKMKNELQDLTFARLYPEERKSIINRLEYLKADEYMVVDKIETHIKKTINDFGIQAEVKGREKTPCSIWQKMKLKNISFSQLSDIIAFRVIVNDVLDCYQVLGIIHAAYHMIPGSFKDYVSTPKKNGYSSLHTVVVGPNKHRIEIQIRTIEMNYVNEWGVAAHWGYKQNINLSSNDQDQYQWIKELLNILENSEAEDFIEHTKLEMYEDQVFCFTPKGEIIALPKGATPVDFAYSLHSDIGNTCSTAKVNGNLVPLKTILENGDQVEIISAKNQNPSPSWEKFVVTARAKSEVRRFIRSKQKKEYISLGKSIIIKFFSNEGKKFNEEEIGAHLSIFHKKNIEDLYLAVGEGSISRNDVFKGLYGNKQNHLTMKKLKEKLSFFKFKKKVKSKESSVSIKGTNSGMSFNLADCCHPIPGDQIIGLFDNKQKGIIIHTADCNCLNSANQPQDQWIEVSWEKENNDNKHSAQLKMSIINEVNSLATICSTIAKYNCNINNLKCTARSPDFFELMLDVDVLGLTQLNNIIASLRSKECIHSIERFKT